jgi:hypothetical protein
MVNYTTIVINLKNAIVKQTQSDKAKAILEFKQVKLITLIIEVPMASAESFNAKIKSFRSSFRGVKKLLNFFCSD